MARAGILAGKTVTQSIMILHAPRVDGSHVAKWLGNLAINWQLKYLYFLGCHTAEVSFFLGCHILPLVNNYVDVFLRMLGLRDMLKLK
jgi:hypothetical protein